MKSSTAISRGLIEAFPTPICARCAQGHPRRSAVASLKPSSPVLSLPCPESHPRRSAVASLKRRRCGRRDRATARSSTAISRGLIEAPCSRRSRDDHPPRHPRRSAVASLKQIGQRHAGAGDRMSSTAISRGLIEATMSRPSSTWWRSSHPRRSAVASLKP